MATQVTVIGNVGGAPERRTTSKGDAYARFRVASNERRMDEQGRWVDGGTSWFDVQAYGALAENVLASLASGQRVVVQGDLTIAEWTGKDEVRRTTARVRAAAVGHDLLFGTTVFRRPDRQSPPAGRTPAAAEEADETGDQWAPVRAPGSAAPAAGALVGAGTWDDAPF